MEFVRFLKKCKNRKGFLLLSGYCNGAGRESRSRSATRELRSWQQVARGRFVSDPPLAGLTLDSSLLNVASYLVRDTRIELARLAWEASVLPLY